MSARDLLATLFEAWNAHDAVRAAACFAEDGIYREADGREVAGRAEIGGHFARFFRTGPPWRFDVDEVVCEGERAAVAYRFGVKGQGGDWSERGGCAMVRLRGGLVQLWHEYRG